MDGLSDSDCDSDSSKAYLFPVSIPTTIRRTQVVQATKTAQRKSLPGPATNTVRRGNTIPSNRVIGCSPSQRRTPGTLRFGMSNFNFLKDTLEGSLALLQDLAPSPSPSLSGIRPSQILRQSKSQSFNQSCLCCLGLRPSHSQIQSQSQSQSRSQSQSCLFHSSVGLESGPGPKRPRAGGSSASGAHGRPRPRYPYPPRAETGPRPPGRLESPRCSPSTRSRRNSSPEE